MSHSGVSRVFGSAVTAGPIVWNDGEEDRPELKTPGGFYLVLLNVSIDRDELDADVFTAIWSSDRLLPQEHQYHTREHVHDYLDKLTNTTATSGTGPRLVYQTPVQFWSSGLLPALDDLTLSVSHKCDVEMIAVHCGSTSSLGSMGLILR